jgi:hypothetical protein
MSSSTVAATRRRHWLTLRAMYGEPITYRAGDLVLTNHPITGERLKGVPARVDATQVATGESTVATSRSQDWLLDPDELVDETGQRVEPRHGHTITRESGEIFKVQPTDTSDDVWRWSDGFHTWRRVFSERR